MENCQFVYVWNLSFLRIGTRGHLFSEVSFVVLTIMSYYIFWENVVTIGQLWAYCQMFSVDFLLLVTKWAHREFLRYSLWNFRKFLYCSGKALKPGAYYHSYGNLYYPGYFYQIAVHKIKFYLFVKICKIHFHWDCKYIYYKY